MKGITPIYDTLQEYLSKKPMRMHVPFHCGIANNPAFPRGLYEMDISEVSGYDLDGEDNPIFQSEKITADFFNVSHSFYVTGGASVGLLASMIALRKHGKKVILARNVHKSVLNGVVLAGLEPVWLDVDFLSEWGVFSKINPDKLSQLIDKNDEISGCVIVSPTYEGVISDIKTISKICHKKNIPLVVDEAHGSHLKFLNNSSAVQWSDLVIQSWHKSLGALTQTGVLHLANERFFDYNDIKRSLDLVSSTSPSFLLLLSLELTRKHLQDTRGEYFKTLESNSKKLRDELAKLDIVKSFENDDLLKIYLKPKKATGIDFAYELYKNHSVEIESANDVGFLMMVGVSFNFETMEKVLLAVKNTNCKSSVLPSPKSNDLVINQMFDPRKAFFCGFKNNDYEYGCDIKAPCPPGYVLSVPGSKSHE